MSMQLYIIYGATTLDFQADGYKLIDGFFPETPDEGAENVSDQFDIHIKGSSGSDLKSKINAIQLAFEHAKIHKDDAAAAYLYFDVDDSGDAWRSKLLGGEISYRSSLDHNWRDNKCIATITVLRKPYWDAKTEVQVPLSNGNGTDNITGLTVFNHDDGGGASPNHHDNWVSIAAADVLGDLPGPTRLEITNTYATQRLNTIWIGHNWTDPDNFAHILEGESSSSGSIIDEITCSNGHYIRYVLDPGVEEEMFTWALADSLLDASKGYYFKILVRFELNTPTSVKFRLKLKYQAVSVWQSGLITMDTSRAFAIRDLFTIRLPPWLLGQNNLSALTMTFSGITSNPSSVNVNIDFLQITPLDGWRMVETVAYGIPQNSRLVDDGMIETKYIDDGAGDNKAGIVVGYGNPIALYPGKKQKLYFLTHSNIGNTAEIDRTISVKLFYRPRRKTL